MQGAPLGIALLGAGGFASDAHLPAIAATDSLDLRAVYSRSRKSAQELRNAAARFAALDQENLAVYADDDASSGGLDALLKRDDIHAVALCLPIPVQPRIIRRCLAAGKHVLSEKPIAPALDEARALLDEYEREYAPNGILWLVAEQFPYAPAWEKARTLVRDGKLGTLVGFDAQVFIQPSLKAGATNWRRVPEYQGGFLLDGGVHFFAALRHVLSGVPNLELTSLAAHVTQLNPDLPPADTLRTVLSTSDPKLGGTLTLSFGTPQPSDAKVYTFRGSRAVLTVDLSAQRTHLLTLVSLPSAAAAEDDAEGPLPPQRVEIELPAQTAVEAEFAAFAAAILAGPAGAEARHARERNGPRAAMRDLAAVEGALQSGERGGERVDLKVLVGERAWEIK